MTNLIQEFWSNIDNIEKADTKDIQSDILTYLTKITESNNRLEEAVRVLEKTKTYLHSELLEEVDAVIKHIKGENGHDTDNDVIA